MRAELMPCNLNQAVCLIRMKASQCPDYYNYVLQSNITSVVINLLTVQAAQPNLSMGNIANIKVPVPLLEDQIVIAGFLDAKCKQIDDTLAIKQSQLETMRAHKTSLIYEYVTGKKRVKEVTNHAN